MHPSEWVAAIDRVPSPSLLVDLEIVDRNIERMRDLLDDRSVVLRPHFKAHKCTTLMRRQVERGGAVGVTCATAHEAVALGNAGFGDILIANEVADRWDVEAIAAVARTARVTVVVDHPMHVARYEAAAAAYDVQLSVLIDIDPGLGRTGMDFDDTAIVRLAASVAAAGHLEFVGIQAYEGHVQGQRDPGMRRVLSMQVAALVRDAVERLRSAGYECPVVSGGGTGTAAPAIEAGGFTELQAGSYVLMDASYGAIDVGFGQALFGVATVISRRSARTAAINAGTKAMNVDEGMPVVLSPDVRITRMDDEHGRLAVGPDAELQVGDRLLLVPSHVDPTVNLHDVLHVATDAGVERWPVDGRRSWLTGWS